MESGSGVIRVISLNPPVKPEHQSLIPDPIPEIHAWIHQAYMTNWANKPGFRSGIDMDIIEFRDLYVI
jgi:hypothetical protein